MNIAQIEVNLQKLILDYTQETFIYELLLAYGLPKASITRLQKGNLNLSKIEGEISWKKKLFFKPVFNQDLHLVISEIKSTLKQDQRFVIVTDFKTLLAIDTKTTDSLDIDFNALPKHFDFFLPWAGMEKATHQNENPADVKAAEKMAKLFDEIKKDNPDISKEFIHGLNVFLSRLLFCYFAEDTGIFEKNLFTHSIQNHTQTDGSDLSDYLDKVFAVMNTAPSDRTVSGVELPVYLDAFPYVNGGLFKTPHKAPIFTRRSRQAVLDCGDQNWAAINPDIFGSMFQAVISVDQRGSLGQHYTSVPNIMKVIEPLFLNDLYAELENSKTNIKKLNELLKRIWNLKIFDPACGSGNFLIIAYKELRKLEMLIFTAIDQINKTYTTQYSGISLNHFYGIEIDDFAHEIAILSLWLAEHQMNQEFFKAFGRTKPALPLEQTGSVVHGNATRVDWEMVCPKKENDEIYILGNPPYLGSSMQNAEQKDDMTLVFKGFKNYKNLDYIAAWFIKGANYIQNHNAQFAFVSTNSICQGEQVALLWPPIFDKNLEIGFAHTSFKWKNNAKANAGVSVVIIGIRNIYNKSEKYIFTDIRKINSLNINPYLSNGHNIIVEKRQKQLSFLPTMTSGIKAGDGGNLILNEDEKNNLLKEYPESKLFIKDYIGADDLMNGGKRYCIWVTEQNKELSYSIPPLLKRFEKCRELRIASTKAATRKKAEFPHQFDETTFIEADSIIIPQTGSEKRNYVPIGFLNSGTIISNAARAIYNAESYLFSLISSKIHIQWVRAVAGRLKMDMQYSNTLCYNTFPFPSINSTQKEELEQCVFRILEERENHSEKTLAQLYDPEKMPAGLREAHRLNDLAVERCYRSKPFDSDEERLEYLFKLYEKMIVEEKEKDTLFAKEKKVKK
ncbi:type I restriction-modification system DNA methylase subunit [Flavobacterium sp. CG_9.1]|uniref:class I SAM-dependent DNA methyltransferase n=1 Tax=Flavobacterium sp. CG_9.1 TaxID=2787728 RepID=UPI0018CAF920|nr:DNA methyltransferase [Flavobacterium sp. CG_9.1]MBG6063365.1 type I restriction-modification system DNA methylase subunit [Flavobacterium sp. CG_9.1]